MDCIAHGIAKSQYIYVYIKSKGLICAKFVQKAKFIQLKKKKKQKGSGSPGLR